jgi:hypothetical protein
MFSLTINRRRFVLMLAAVGLLFCTACTAPFQAERQYVSAITSNARNTLNTLNQLQELAGRARLGDPEWEAQVDAQIARLRGLIAEARQITPPPQFTDFHQNYLDTMSSLEQMTGTYEQAKELRNHELLQQAQQHIEQGKAIISDLQQRVTELLEQINESSST